MSETLKKISADEAHSMRKEVANDAGVMAKGLPVRSDVVKAARFDPATRTARFVMSAEVADRMGDVVVQEGLDTANFEANPVGLLFHNSRAWPIGKWANVSKQLGGRPKRTEGDLILLPEGDDPDADRAGKHMAAGVLRTVSIGFRPNWHECEAIIDGESKRCTGLRFNKSELLECSLVPIPALPAATMKELSAGMLSAESKEMIKGILETFSLKDGEVLDREVLETAVREAEGNRTTHSILLPKEISLKNDGMTLSFEKDGAPSIVFDFERFVVKDSDKPQDAGEAPPVAPSPGDDETAKAAPFTFKDGVLTVRGIMTDDLAGDAAAQAASVAEFEAHRKAIAEVETVLREDGRPDSLTTRILRAILPIRAKAAQPAEPITPPAPAPADVERRAAALARASELKEAGEKLAA